MENDTYQPSTKTMNNIYFKYTGKSFTSLPFLVIEGHQSIQLDKNRTKTNTYQMHKTMTYIMKVAEQKCEK